MRYEIFAYDHSLLTLEFFYVSHDTRAPGIRRSLVPVYIEIVGSLFPVLAIAIVMNVCSILILLRQYHFLGFCVSLKWTKVCETPYYYFSYLMGMNFLNERPFLQNYLLQQ